MASSRILLINPWIMDFAAYDFWNKPLGLLSLAAVLRDAGARLDFIDCMDRFDPELQRACPGRAKPGKYGTGKYLRRVIRKPAVYADIPRYYARYGMPLELFRARLRRLQEPAAVVVTSGMTYWYPGVQTAIEEVRRVFGAVPVLLGGIYATLLPEHAKRHSGADMVLTGEAENRITQSLCAAVPGLTLQQRAYAELDTYPLPAWEVYHHLPYGVVMTSRGCPLRCSFCASAQISGRYRWRQPEAVVEEIATISRDFEVRDIALYDDALLTNHQRHLRPILRMLRRRGLPVRFHTPNGLQCKFLDQELAAEMRATGFRTMRLSLESVSPERQRDMSRKVNTDSFARAAHALHAAGFETADLDAYVMMALPGQPLLEVLQTMAFVHANRIGIRLAAYSPIPGTVDYARAIEQGFIAPDDDPLRTNNSVLPVRAAGLNFEAYNRVSLLAKTLNAALRTAGAALEPEPDLWQRLCSQFSREELEARRSPAEIS